MGGALQPSEALAHYLLEHHCPGDHPLGGHIHMGASSGCANHLQRRAPRHLLVLLARDGTDVPCEHLQVPRASRHAEGGHGGQADRSKEGKGLLHLSEVCPIAGRQLGHRRRAAEGFGRGPLGEWVRQVCEFLAVRNQIANQRFDGLVERQHAVAERLSAPLRLSLHQAALHTLANGVRQAHALEAWLARGVRREPLHALRQSALCVLAVRCVVQREQSDVSQFLRVQGSQAQSLSHARLRRLARHFIRVQHQQRQPRAARHLPHQARQALTRLGQVHAGVLEKRDAVRRPRAGGQGGVGAVGDVLGAEPQLAGHVARLVGEHVHGGGAGAAAESQTPTCHLVGHHHVHGVHGERVLAPAEPAPARQLGAQPQRGWRHVIGGVRA
mmetsp:Transcript_30923/g.59690  ORF Transcript_30923/g.59690 Transcript_30923/m.59690 type:complete len:385 (+) Transcript_30923:946-2100(+)